MSQTIPLNGKNDRRYRYSPLVFILTFIIYFLISWVGLLFVVESSKDGVNSINGTLYIPLIFGTYWISVIISGIAVSISFVKKYEKGKFKEIFKW